MNRGKFDAIVKKHALWSGGDLIVNWDKIYEEITAYYREMMS